MGKITSIWKNKSSRGIRSSSRTSLTVVASSSVIANNELHYILTSMFNINLVERNARDVMIEEGRQGWADLLLDERTCVLLRPLATLRSDAHLNELTCQLVLLSLQCTTCYILLYGQESNSSGYEFRSSVVRALTRLVATCVLFRTPEYVVSLLLAYSLHQVGEVVRDLCEVVRASSPVWNPEEWITRPWLTSQMSSHERLLLSLPCINSISAQVILTAMSLLQVLESSLPQMKKALPWISDKVIMMLYKLVHGEPVTYIRVGRYSCESAEEDGTILYKSEIMENTDQMETDGPQFLFRSVDNHEDYHDSKTAYISVEGKDLDETTYCCEKEDRVVPPVTCQFLPDKISLFATNDVHCEYPLTPNNEAVSGKTNFNRDNTSVVPTTIISSEELKKNSHSSYTTTVVPAASTNRYDSMHLSTSCIPLPGSTDLFTVTDTYSKDPLKNLFNPYKYLHFMEHDKRTEMQPLQQPSWQHQQPSHQHQQLTQQYQQLSAESQYLQPPQQYQQTSQFLQRQESSQQFLQEKGHRVSRRDGDVCIVSPYFHNFHDPQVDAWQPVAPPQLYHHQNQPQPSILTLDQQCLPPTSPTQFLPRTQNETSRSPVPVYPNNGANFSVALENTQYQQGYLSHQE